jgi:hypothetical protein
LVTDRSVQYGSILAPVWLLELIKNGPSGIKTALKSNPGAVFEVDEHLSRSLPF